MLAPSGLDEEDTWKNQNTASPLFYLFIEPLIRYLLVVSISSSLLYDLKEKKKHQEEKEDKHLRPCNPINCVGNVSLNALKTPPPSKASITSSHRVLIYHLKITLIWRLSMFNRNTSIPWKFENVFVQSMLNVRGTWSVRLCFRVVDNNNVNTRVLSYTRRP